MYCENCGKKIKENDKFCPNCGNSIKKIKEDNKVISILGLIFSFFLPVIGIILSIISLIKVSKLKKENNIKNKYLGLNIASLIIGSIFLIIYIIALIFIIVYFSFLGVKGPTGKYECKKTLLLYTDDKIYLNLNRNKTFSIEDYNKNNISGNYSYQEINTNNRNVTYKINFNIEKYVSNGNEENLEESKKHRIGTIYKNTSNNATIFYTNGNYFSCKKINK